MTTEILIAVPLLRRPHRVVPLLQSIRDATPEDHRILLMCTNGDTAVITVCQIAAAERTNVEVVLSPPAAVGDFARKINTAYRMSDEPFIFTGADDLAFQPGWWSAARRYFDDPQIGVVGTNDLAPTERARNGEHATHSVVRRDYADSYGLIDGTPGILFESYVHEWCDNELVETAKHRHAWVYAFDSVVEHTHPHWNKAPTDQMYRQSQRRMIQSRPLFNQRKKLWS